VCPTADTDVSLNKNFLHLPGHKSKFLVRPARSVVTIVTELSGLLSTYCVSLNLGANNRACAVKKKETLTKSVLNHETNYRYAPHNDVSVNDGGPIIL